MAETSLVVPTKNAVGWYEATIPVRGCAFDLAQIKRFYIGLTKINREFGEKVIASLPRDTSIDDTQWEQRKLFLLDDAFSITVTMKGQHNEQLYGEDANVFQPENAPVPIATIFLTNATAWKRNAQNSAPPNEIEVLLDFRKPALLDPNPLVSEATPNESSVTINAREMTYFRAVRQLVEDELLSKQTVYSMIHRNYAYDFGIWFVVLPTALLLTTYYMDQWLPADGPNSSYRWAFFIYGVGVVLVGYRVLVSYTKWAFPVTILKENKDQAWKHRVVIGGIFAWLFYKAFDILWSLVSPI